MFLNVKPRQINPINWGWKNEMTPWGPEVIEHPGVIRMPSLLEKFDWRTFEVELPPQEWKGRFSTVHGFGTRNFKSIFTTCARFVGYLELLMDRPDLSPITEQYVAWNERLLSTWELKTGYPLTYFMIGDDYGHNTGLLMRPDDWREYVKPHIGQLFELAKRYGCKIIFHSDGDISEIIDDIVGMGAGIINCQLVGKMKKLPIKKNGDGSLFYGETEIWENTPEMVAKL